jgi:hypothetical protein
MADRIFPSAEKDSLGSAKQINTIDWDAFAKSFRTAAEDEKPKAEKVNVGTMTISELESAIKEHMEPGDNDIRKFCEECPDDKECKPHCDEWLAKKDDEEEEEEEVEEDEGDQDESDEGDEGKPKEGKMKDLTDHFKKNPGKLDKLKGGLKDYMKKKLNHDGEKTEEKDDKVVRAKEVMCEKCAGKGCKACGDKKMASSEGRVIVFNHPNEISAEALMSAKTAGDDVKVRAILAAREQRNRVIEAKLESLAQDEANKTEKLAARRNYRANIIAEAEKTATRLASADAVVTKKSEKEGFKSVTSMKNDEKVIVAQRLLDNGFPKEYVEATLGLNMTKATISTEEVQIREVMSSSLNDTTKRTAVAGLVKVAKLSDEQLERCIRFWVDELGYGDEQWVRDLFTSKY